MCHATIGTPTVSWSEKKQFSLSSSDANWYNNPILPNDTYHDTIVGKSGVSIRWVSENHENPVIAPIIEPTITWFHVWYCKYVLLKHTSTVKHQHETKTNKRPARSNGSNVLLFMWCNLNGGGSEKKKWIHCHCNEARSSQFTVWKRIKSHMWRKTRWTVSGWMACQTLRQYVFGRLDVALGSNVLIIYC